MELSRKLRPEGADFAAITIADDDANPAGTRVFAMDKTTVEEDVGDGVVIVRRPGSARGTAGAGEEVLAPNPALSLPSSPEIRIFLKFRVGGRRALAPPCFAIGATMVQIQGFDWLLQGGKKLLDLDFMCAGPGAGSSGVLQGLLREAPGLGCGIVVVEGDPGFGQKKD